MRRTTNKLTRRDVVAGTGSVVACAAIFSSARAADRVPVIGYIAQRSGPWPLDKAFTDGLAQLGHLEGKTYTIAWKWGPDPADLPALARELVAAKVSVIVTSGYPANKAAKDATTTIPIVMATSGDAVQEGLVQSLARPGGNITGLSVLNRELSGKRVQVLMEAVPNLKKIGALFNGSNPAMPPQFTEVQAAAAHLGVMAEALDIAFPQGIDGAFRAAAERGLGAIMVLSDSATIAHRAQLAERSLAYRMPTIYANRGYLQAGGFISYGPDLTDNFRRAAAYVDRILRGENPATMPVEQPTRFELVINQKTAKAMGIDIPQTLLFRADEVFE